MMMQPAAGHLSRAFRSSTGSAAYHRFVLRQQEAERERRERKEELRSDEAELMDFTLAIVSTSEIAQFGIELDRYDAAAIAALQDNEQDLLVARKRVDELLEKAHVLPDGRRVFKTEDGLRVFDEHGVELDASIIDPSEIDDFRPHWEVYKPELDALNGLMAERDELLDYQQKLDEARERLDAGDMTRDEYERWRDQLVADMPAAVREQIPELADHDAKLAAEAASPAAAQDAALAVDDDMVPTSQAPRAFAPTFSG